MQRAGERASPPAPHTLPARVVAPPLQERIARLEAQCRAKHDAAESSIEERLRDREAIEAENAAAAARLQENEAMVGALGGRRGRARGWCQGQQRGRWLFGLGCTTPLGDPQPIRAPDPFPSPPPHTHTTQMRKVQEKIVELREAHARQLEGVMAQYAALLQQVQAYHAGMEAAMQGDGGSGAAAPAAVKASRVR